jgi:hypothetical protein
MLNTQVLFSRLGERFFSLKPLVEARFFMFENFLSDYVKDYYDICFKEAG